MFDSAILNNCSPCLDNSALFAVTTLIFFSKAFLTNSKLIPFSSPINSTKTLQLFIFNKSNGSLNHLKSSTLTGYKKNDVVKAMGKAIINSKIEYLWCKNQ